MTEPTQPPTSADVIHAAVDVAAALKTLASAGISFDTAASTYTDHGRAALAAALGTPLPGETDDVLTCGHPDGCTNPATHQTGRAATDDEAAAHWDALEENIRSKGNPDYIQNRNDTITVAEHRCDDPDHAHPDYLNAIAARDAYTEAVAELSASTAGFTAEQLRHLADAIRGLNQQDGPHA